MGAPETGITRRPHPTLATAASAGGRPAETCSDVQDAQPLGVALRANLKKSL